MMPCKIRSVIFSLVFQVSSFNSWFLVSGSSWCCSSSWSKTKRKGCLQSTRLRGYTRKRRGFNVSSSHSWYSRPVRQQASLISNIFSKSIRRQAVCPRCQGFFDGQRELSMHRCNWRSQLSRTSSTSPIRGQSYNAWRSRHDLFLTSLLPSTETFRRVFTRFSL